MFEMHVGQPKSGKTETIKKELKNNDKKLLILDFNDEFSASDGKIYNFENFHPLIGKLSEPEIKVINAGYLKTSRCLYEKATLILKEEKIDSKEGIIQEALERLHASFEYYAVEYYKELSQRIPIKVNPKSLALDEIVDYLMNADKLAEEEIENSTKKLTQSEKEAIRKKTRTVIIKSKSIYSDHLRTMTYLLLYKMSLQEDLEVKIIADEISSLFFKGNLKLFFDVFDVNKFDIVMSCNKVTNIPKLMEDKVKSWKLFKNGDKKEIEILQKNFGLVTKTKLSDLSLGKYITVNRMEEGLNKTEVL